MVTATSDITGLSENLGLRSLVDNEGYLQIKLVEQPLPEPADDEVIMRVEASPLNPSDIFTLVGPADVTTGETAGQGIHTVYRARLRDRANLTLNLRKGKPLKCGIEGAGTVVSAGASPQAQALLGKTVAAMDGALYCRFRTLKASQCLPLPEGITAREGAACFVNPLTVLGFIETARRDGYEALVHTAAASNLGQMLVKLCREENVKLVNIVRSEKQVKLLESIGADHVLNSNDADFSRKLTADIDQTSAYTVFDAIGGGDLLGTVLTCMEAAGLGNDKLQNPYGTDIRKQGYVYGSLDNGPTIIHRNFGFNWSINGWLLLSFLASIDAETLQKLRNRVIEGLQTTFASHYTAEISLTEVMQADVVSSFSQLTTGEKYLINPTLAL